MRIDPRQRDARLAAVVALLLPTFLLAQTNFLPPAPEPEPASVRVERGGSVVIPLRASRGSSLQLDFLIRSQPEHGQLGEPKIKSRTEATVVYTPAEDAPLGTDGFRYALQAANTAVSVPATVTIEIVDPPARLVVPEALDFGTTPVGDVVVEELTVRNIGRGTASGSLRVPAPWRLLDPPAFAIAAAETARFRIAFAPGEANAYRERATWSLPGVSPVTLSGRATHALSVDPEAVVLRDPDRPDSTRAEIRITNHSQAARLVEITPPASLSAPAELTVGPASTAKLELKPSGPEAGSAEDLLVLRSADWERRLPVEVFATPGILECSPEKLSFGEVREGRRYKRELLLTNRGGSALQLQAEVPDGVRLTPPLAGRRLEPGEELRTEVTVEPNREQNAESIVLSSDDQRFSIPIELALEEPERPKSVIVQLPELQPAVPGEPEDPTLEAALTAEQSETVFAAISILERGTDRMLLAWKTPDPPPTLYHVEERLVRSGPHGQPTLDWQPLENVEVSIGEEITRAELTRLQPGSVVSIRLVPEHAGGVRGTPTGVFRLSTSPVVPTRIPWLWVFLAIAALVLAASLLYRRFRSRS